MIDRQDHKDPGYTQHADTEECNEGRRQGRTGTAHRTRQDFHTDIGFIEGNQQMQNMHALFNHGLIGGKQPVKMLPEEPQEQHEDGTWTAYIRMSFRGEEMDIPTSINVSKRQIDSEFYITNEDIIARLTAMIADIRKNIEMINLDEVDSLRGLLILLAGKDESIGIK